MLSVKFFSWNPACDKARFTSKKSICLVSKPGDIQVDSAHYTEVHQVVMMLTTDRFNATLSCSGPNNNVG